MEVKAIMTTWSTKSKTPGLLVLNSLRTKNIVWLVDKCCGWSINVVLAASRLKKIF